MTHGFFLDNSQETAQKRYAHPINPSIPHHPVRKYAHLRHGK